MKQELGEVHYTPSRFIKTVSSHSYVRSVVQHLPCSARTCQMANAVPPVHEQDKDQAAKWMLCGYKVKETGRFEKELLQYVCSLWNNGFAVLYQAYVTLGNHGTTPGLACLSVELLYLSRTYDAGNIWNAWWQRCGGTRDIQKEW